MKKDLLKDASYVSRGENGSIEFARFEDTKKHSRKMDNDVAFIKSILNAKEEDDFRLIREETDELGITHKRYQQYYKGIKVDDAEYLLHGKNGNIEVMNGDYQDVTIESVKPTLNEQQAKKKALEYVGAVRYLWECSEMEEHIKQRLNDPNATAQPKGELVIAKDFLKGSNSLKLSWKLPIFSLEPYNKQMIFVDATNGDIINDLPIFLNTNTAGTAQTMYSGTQSIVCDSYASGYRLYESRPTTSGNSAIVHTKNLQNNTSGSVEFSNSNTNWTSASWSTHAQNKQGLDAHWGAEKVLDYLKTIHNRNSLNNSGLTIMGYARYGTNYNNAGWDGWALDIVYGDGDGTNYNPFTALDIVAHEMGHGLVQFTAGLSGSANENGSLNEGLCDILAACVKNWAASSKPIWRLASEIFPSGSSYNSIRDMQNPKSSQASGGPSPNTYQGQYWASSPTSPHRNSTVISHWFYLLCQGGTGTNDAGASFNVSGIGISKAEKIVYLSLSYLASSANFYSARLATLQAAGDIYGFSSTEIIAVMNAWNAVNVLQPARTLYLGFHYISGPSGVTVNVNGDGFLGNQQMTQPGSQNYTVNNYTGNTYMQTVSVPSGRYIDLEEEPRGDHVVTGEGTNYLTVTYYLYRAGTTVNSLILKFSVR